MDFFETVAARYSIRSFVEKEIEAEKIDKILATVNLAPSAGNLQAYQIFVVRDRQKKKQLAHAAVDQEFVGQASVVLVFCSHPARSSSRYGKRGEELYCLQDATIAASYAQLAVTALGLSSCWVGAFLENEVLAVLGNPKDVIPVCLLPIGYSAEKPGVRQRRQLRDLVHEV